MAFTKINNRTVLHIVDRVTKFAAAAFLKGESTAHVWEALMLKWIAVYDEYSDKVL